MPTFLTQLQNLVLALSIVLTTSSLTLASEASDAATSSCPEWLDHDFKQLHKDNMINLCELTKDKPVLVINTASHCGFTRQFKTLEVIHQTYKDQGLVVVGFASDSFNQEAGAEEEIAEVCYINYGVSFTMMSPIAVKGDEAHPLFKHLALKSSEPKWNFNKFLISKDRESITHMGSGKLPTPSTIERLL